MYHLDVSSGVLSLVIHEAGAKKGDLTVVWLDLANAYGSTLHDLIRTALKYYHIPDHIRAMISSYLDGIKLHLKKRRITSNSGSISREGLSQDVQFPLSCLSWA